MDQKNIKEALNKLKETSKKRNFAQKIDLIINLKNLNLKKPDDQVDMFVSLHYSNTKDKKICALVGPELREEAEKVCDKAILADDFDKYAKDKKAIKKLADEFDFFLGQANIMPKIAQIFGRVFGPKQKMPNPKAGCVVPPKTALGPLYERLKKTVRLVAKIELSIKTIVGSENSPENEVIDNILTVYNALVHKLPNEKNNIKNVLIKYTMGKPIQIKH